MQRFGAVGVVLPALAISAPVLAAARHARVDPVPFKHVEGIAAPIGGCADGNELSHHAVCPLEHAGAPWKTRQRSRPIMESQYAPRPDGLDGNGDPGQISARYIFRASGFCPVTPASDDNVIGRPFVARAAIRLPGGLVFTIGASPLDDAHPHVGTVMRDGNVPTAPFQSTMPGSSPLANCTSPCRLGRTGRGVSLVGCNANCQR